MSLVVSKSTTSGNRAQAPAGTHQGYLKEIKDLGMRPNPFGEEKHRVGLIFELDARDGGGRPYEITRWVNLSLYERSTLAQLLQDWLEVDFKSLPKDFDLETLIGRKARIRVTQKRGQQGDMISDLKSIEPAGDQASLPTQAAVPNTLPDDDPFSDDV